MNYFDTNVLLYALLNQDGQKMQKSQKLISQNIEDKTFAISTLTMQELVFVLSKNGYSKQELKSTVDSFLPFCIYFDQKETFLKAFSLCNSLDFCKNINDCLHLKIAENSCGSVITFDADFEKFKPCTNIQIEILK